MSQNRDFEGKKRQLLERLIRLGYLRDKRLFQAFMEIPLEDFIPREYLNTARIYEDTPNLFYFQNEENFRTISAPHMISIMLQGLALITNDDLLILGAKSGYIAALAHKLAPKGEIVIVEANSDIAKITMDNLEKLNLQDNISVNVKNPLEGMPELSPWQKILVTGAINQDRIHPLLRQLDTNEGVLYAPIGEEYIQVYTQILRIENEYYGRKQLQVKFTPLMTQVELDDLQLITDVDEIDIQENPKLVDDTLNKITIKYTSNILDKIEITEAKEQGIKEDDKEHVLQLLKSIQKNVKKLKLEGKITNFFKYVNEIEEIISNIKNFKQTFNLKIKKIHNIINQITTFAIVRRDLEKKEINNPAVIDKKVEIIQLQMQEIDVLLEFLQQEIKRIQSL
ncbi:MAG: hypothetical protein ACTSR8_01200 [Promethearchaeota archaeon]